MTRQTISASDDPLTLAAKLNAMFTELYNAGPLDESPIVLPFLTSVPLASHRPATMPPHSITGPLTFTPAPGAVIGSAVRLLLTADGVHAPVFSGGFQQDAGSPGWNNTAGIVNAVTFRYDLSGALYAVFPQT